MASPEVLEPSGILDSESNEVLSAPEGWTKKLVLKKGGTPKKKDVVYVSPDGEEIRHKRQLEKYLKNHPGGPSVAEFDWSTGETPRRSARLSSKGRLSNDSLEAEPSPKRSKVEDDDEPCIVSPRKGSRRKPAPQTIAGKDEVMEDAVKAEVGDTTAEDTAVGSDAKPAEDKVVPSGHETLENNTDGKHEEEIVVTIGEVNPGESAEQVPSIEELASVETSADKVNAEEKVSEIEEPLSVPDTVMEEVTVVEEVTLEQPAAISIEVPAVEEVVKPSDGETSLMQVEDVTEVTSQDILDVPTTDNLDVLDDPLKPKEHIEPQGIHALIEESVLSGVAKSPEQQTDLPLPAAERVRLST